MEWKKTIAQLFCGGTCSKTETLRLQLENKIGVPREDFWNSMWSRNSVKYKTKPGQTIDVRRVFDCSWDIIPELQRIVDKITYRKTTDDDKALAILNWCRENLIYVSDKKHHNTPEHWQSARDTFMYKKGDCEDGSILCMKLMQLADIPAFKRKLCCGWVKGSNGSKGGHAYVIYLASNDEWYPMDWCYYGSSSINKFKTVKHSDREEYMDIWWTTNEQYSWSQKSFIIKKKLKPN